MVAYLLFIEPYLIKHQSSIHVKRDCERLAISPSPLDVKAADKRSVLGIVVYILWLHECAYVCFRRHLIQWGTGAASSDLPTQKRTLNTSSTTSLTIKQTQRTLV